MPAAKSKKPTLAKSTKKPSAASGARGKKASAATARKPATAATKARKKAGSKREVIEPHKGDKRYVRRTAAGTFGKTVDMGKSLSADKRSKATKRVPKGQGDRGDTRR